MRHLLAGAALLSFGSFVAVAPAPPARAAELEPRLIDPEQVEPVTSRQFGQVLEHHRGQVVVVNVWATWCIPCVQELPELDVLHERYRERGVRVLAVSIDEPGLLDKRVRAFFRDKAPHLVSYLAIEDSFEFLGSFVPDWLGALPTSIFIDRQGTVRHVETGRLLYQEVEKRVLALLAE